MPTYVSLLNWTDQGVRNVKDTLQRADIAAELAQKHGDSLQLYWTVGAYDIVYILEAPDDRALPPSFWRLARLATSGRLRFAPTTAKRCRASLGGLADLSVALRRKQR